VRFKDLIIKKERLCNTLSKGDKRGMFKSQFFTLI